MKTKVIGIIGLALLGVAAGGCSTEAGDKGQSTGSASLPLTSITAARMGAASVVINDSGVDKLLVIGGFSSSGGSGVNTVYLYDPVNDSWSSRATLPAGQDRGDAKAILLPGTDKVLLVGGRGTDSATTASKGNSLIYDFSLDQWSPTSFGSANLVAARTDFQLVTCGTGTGETNARILAFGGSDYPAGSTTYTNVVEMYNPSTNSWSNVETLITARAKLAVGALETTGANAFTKFIVAGGEDGSGASNQLEVMTVTTACGSPDLREADANLGSTRKDPVVFAEGSSNTFLVAGGDGLSTSDKIVVASWTPGMTFDVTQSAGDSFDSASARGRSALVEIGNNVYIIGGVNSSTAKTDVDVWNKVTKEYVAPDIDLATARYRTSFGYLPSVGLIVVAGGYDGSSVLSTAEAIP